MRLPLRLDNFVLQNLCQVFWAIKTPKQPLFGRKLQIRDASWCEQAGALHCMGAQLSAMLLINRSS